MAGDLSSDLDLRILAPSPAVRGVEGNAPNPNPNHTAPRRRVRPEEEFEGDDGEPEAGDEHRLDRLA